jgi:exodeoxyribonuclease-5
MPLKQLLFERVNDGKEIGINLKYGSVSSSTSQVRNNWNTAFELSPNIEVDIHGPYLNVKKALEWLEANPKASIAQKFNAIGVNLTDTAEVNKVLFKGDKDSGIPGGLLDDFINRLRNDSSIKTTDFDKRINSITDLIKDYSVKNTDEQGNETYEKVKGLGGFYKTLQEVEFKYSNNYNSFMGTNAEGETASELVLNSSITHQINGINNAQTLQELTKDNAFEHLDGNLDPFKKANTWLNELFDENGKKQSTKQGNVAIEYENFSGTKYFQKLIGENEYESLVERGLSNMSLDENSKFITDVYLSYYGKAEAPRMADKSSSFHFGLNNAKPIFDVTDAKAIKTQADTNNKMYSALKKYIAAEIVRINTLKSATGNIDKNYKARGQEFFIFDALLTNETKGKLKEINSTNFDEVLKEVEKSKSVITKEINQYFKEKTDNTLKNKKDTFYLAEGVRTEISGNAKTKLSVDESKEILISMFERNQFLNYLNFTTMFLGDPALYDVSKEDFHKRIAGIISTGEGFRHDTSMLQTLNTLPFKSGDVVENNKSRNYAQSRVKSGNIKPEKEFRSYDGTVVTAIINDHKVNSIYLDELAEDIKNSLGPYNNMNEADGQGFISFDFYRMLSISQGLWSPVKEAMYNNIVNGVAFDQTRVNEFFESMKLQHFGPVKTDGLPGMAFHKFNLIPLIPNMIKGTKLEDLHDKMMEQGIDYMTFASGSKLTSVSNSESESPNDDYYNKETRETTTDPTFKFTPNIIHVKYLKNQIKIHNEYKGKITLPTQMRAILYAGLMDNGVPKDVSAMFELQEFDKKDFQSKWEEMSETEKLKSNDYQWLVKYEKTIEDIVEFKKQELFNELGITEEADISRSSEKLANLIRSELTRSEIDDAQIDFLFNNSALKNDISLALTEGQVSKMLVSLIDKRLTKMKVNGEGLIQMASTMSEKKGSQWKKATTEEQLEYGTNGLRSYYRKDGKIKAMQVKIALQGDFEKLLYIKGKDGKSIATYITKTSKDGTKVKTLDYDSTLDKLNALMVDPVWKKENMDLFIMTTCRIPGQAMNSVEFMEIHSFLPKIAGNVIILPSEIVAKSGADYDVDKLFTMMANLGLYNGEVKKIKALPKEDINELNSKISTLKENISNKRKEVFDYIEANQDTLEQKQVLSEIKENRKLLKEAIKTTSGKLTTKEKKALAENEKEVAALNAIIDSVYDALGQKSALFGELEAMKSELADLQIKKDGQSIKGLENNLIDVIVERLEREDNYADLVRPNDTNLVDGIAKELESHVSPFNKYQSVHDKETIRTKISSSMIFDPSYNRNKQIENSVGKDTLGIGAVINKYFSMFTRMGMYTNIDSNILTLEDYNEIIAALKEDAKNVGKIEKDLAFSYKNYNLHFPSFNSKIINGKKVIDLAALKNKAGEYIPDILGQMINGWVDVAKGGWIFNIQGNKEATPTLLYLFMAGVPVEDAVNFVSVPAIRNYLEAKRVQQGALHVLNQNATFDRNTFDALIKYEDIDAYKSVVNGLDIDSKTKELYTNVDLVQNLGKVMKLSINDNSPINTAAIKNSFAEPGKAIPISDEVQFDLLNKFIAYENIANQITSLTTATTFDTKASSKLNEVRDKQKKLDSLVKSNPALPVDILKRVDSTIVGKFASSKLILKLFSNFSALKNNKALSAIADKKSDIAFKAGIFPEDNINQFQEDFIWYLYQNESNRITDNTYNDIALVEDESVDKYDYKDGELRYNPTFLNELAFGFNVLNALPHKFGSKNAALKFLAEYGKIDFMDLPKDSMHYILAKKALSDVGINEETIEGKEISAEEYEDLILTAALESKALLASGNRETLMHGPFSYAKRLLEVASEHGELIGKFNFLEDIRHNYNKYSHNISLANIKETGYSKIYRQELEILKAYGEIPEVQELFEQFDHFAVLQSGIRTAGQFNVTEIIDPAHISNVIGNQYDSILESLNKIGSGEAVNYSVLNLYTALNYHENYSKRQLQNKRGGSYENDSYFDNTIQYTNKFDLSYLEGVRKIEIAMARYANSAIIMPYSAVGETEDTTRQFDYFTGLGETAINADLGLYSTAYINSSSEITDPKFVKEYFKKYKQHLDGLNHDNNLTFNIEMKPGANELIIEHLESLGYKKHPMLSGNGLYYAMSKVDSMAVSGLYNTQSTFSIKDDSLLSSSNKNEVVKVSIDQLVSKQLSDKYGLEEKYQAHKSLPNATWSDFIRANVIDNVAIESAYKYVVGKVIEKDKDFKNLLVNTQDAALLQGTVSNKLNNMYARALMTARKSLVQINAVATSPQQKNAVLTTSSGFLSAGTLSGFKRVQEITGAEIFDGEVFNKVESDKLFEIMDREFPKVLADPAQGIPNFANTKSIYFGPIEYKYSTITKAAAPLPSWLDKTVRELEKRMGVIPGYFDTALINRYTGLEQGLGMHTDAEPNLVGKENINPTVLTLSLGAERIFRLEGMSNTPYANEKVGIPTKQGHVLVMGKDSQIKYKHGIEKNSGQAGIRYSITLRHTPDVNPVGRAVEKPAGSTTQLSTSVNPSDYTNHSGGAYGGDTFWDMIGREFGVTKHMHYKDAGNANLSQKLKNAKVTATVLTKEQMDTARTEVERLLGEKYPDTLEGNLQVRNYYQVANADAVFAVAKLFSDKTAVLGGTNTAVQLGIEMNKPTYVWDIVTEGWYKYNGDTFEVTETPTLTKNFAGVGSRDIENYNTKDKKTGEWKPRKEYLGAAKEAAAKQAIKEVYEETFAQPTQSSTSVNEFDAADELTPIQQNFKDGDGGRQMQSKFKDRSTMQLILSGDRTRTTRAKTDIERMMKDYNLSKIEDLVGKVIRMTDKKTGRAYTRITKVVPFTQEYQDATWEKEGWVKSVTDNHVDNYPYAIEFELVSRPVTAIALTESQRFTRESVTKDNEYAYLFTDNAARTSGPNLVGPTGWYASTYGTDKKFPGKTQAVIRGLANAFPITTMVDDKRTQWTDEKFDEFKKEIDREIRRIKSFIGEGYFKGVKFSAEKPFGKGEISNMKDTAPKIWEYLNTKLAEIGIDNTGDTPKVISKSETTTSQTTTDSYQYYGKPYAIVIKDGVGVDVVGYKGKPADKNKLLAKYNENPNVDPQNGKPFRTEPTPVNVEPISGNKPQVNRYELFPGVFANQGQSEAIDKLYDFISSNESEFVLEGAGGTGKTTLIKNLVAELESKGTVLAIGPTHKAKKVLDNSLNRDRKFSKDKINTITLDAALAIKLDEATGEFKPNIKKRKLGWVPMLKADFVIIDESSMLKDDMIAEINQWKKKGAKIIYMGDRAQLPPVGQSSDSKVFGYSNHYLLTEKMRQAATSPIIGIGTVVSDNVKSKDPQVNVITSDMMVNAKDSVSGSELLWEQNEANAINQFVDDVKNSNDPNFAKIITFNNEKNPSGQSVLNLNMKVRNALYGLDAVKNQFMPGERLMAYDTFGDESPVFTNGEDLIVVSNTKKVDVNFNITVYSEAKGNRTQSFKYDVEYLDLINEEGVNLFDIPVIANSSINKFRQDVAALFKTDGQMAYGLLKEFGNLQYGYAITAHKAQGSTYTNTYVMLDNILGNTNLGTPKAKNQALYVAVSRPTTKLVMVTKTAPIDPKSITVGAEKSKYDNDKIGC